jgi:ketosteroid isomerase-like protein
MDLAAIGEDRSALLALERRMTNAEHEVREMVDRETEAWNRQDAEALVSLFHPDIVWPWPPDEHAHDPATWVLPMGRFDRQRWKESWEELFRTHDLVHNRRQTVRVVVSEQGDGGFAVVDVDTLWRHRATGADFPWRGRACKVYTRASGRWWFYFQTGLLEHARRESPP